MQDSGIVQLWNSVNPLHSIFCIKRLYAPLDTRKLKPAIPRWIGFTLSHEAKCIVKHDGGWIDLQGNEFSLDDILTDWVRSDSGAAYPTVLKEVPTPMPFTAREADVWFETNDKKPTLKKIFLGIRKMCSFRAARYIATLNMATFDLSIMGTTMSRIVYLIAKQIKDLKIYVRIGDRT